MPNVPVPPATRGLKRVMWFLVAFYVAACGALLVTPDGFSSIMFLVACIASSVCSVVGLRRNRPVNATAWKAICFAGPLFIVALLLRAYQSEGHPSTVWLSNVNLYNTAGYVVLLVSLVWLVRGGNKRIDVTTWLDAAVVAVGAALLVWTLYITPVSELSAGVGGRVVAGVYPVIDVVFLALVIQMSYRQALRNFAYLGVVVGVLGMFIGDAVFAYHYALTADMNANIPISNCAFVAAFGGFGLASLHPSMRALSASRTRDSSLPRSRKILIVAVVLSPAILQAFTTAHGSILDRRVRTVLLVLLLLVLLARLLRTVGALSVAEAQSRHRATHDVLTGLPNRAAFTDTLRARLSQDTSVRAPMTTLLFLDCDRFKDVNDTWGHPVGDELLIEVAQRLRRVARSDDLLARVGGDEFVIVADHYDTVEAQAMAARILTEFRRPLLLSGKYEMALTPSIGVAHAFRDADTSADDLVRDADIAMYVAKDAGRNGFSVFDDKLRAETDERISLASELRSAIRRHEIVAHYQPLHCIQDGSLLGFEALARWEHPQRGAIAPGVFIRLAEDTADIVVLGGQILRAACVQLAQWRAETGLDLHVSVNVSVVQIARDDVVELVRSALADSGLPAAALWVEVTESTMIDGPHTALRTLTALREMGVTLCIDDFGTGYSALGYLKTYPMKIVKIDRSFVSGIGVNLRDAVLVRTIIAMAHALDMRVVAEGIEDQAQANALRRMGCDIAQGWLYGGAESADVTGRLLSPARAAAVKAGLAKAG